MGISDRIRVPNAWAARILRILARFGVKTHPDDRVLRDNFTRHRILFDELQSMFYVDRHMSFIDTQITRVRGEDDPRPADDPGLPVDRLRRYRELVKELGLKAVGLNGQTITCRVSSVGRSSKGYVFASSHPVFVDHLNSHPHPPEGHAHVKLDGSWNLYYGWDP